ncbi:DUF2283 domain-containing protein [Candidatus Pacearchaeota archaeon]|nr:DUF2283 domain-containing protein [Candidatus Pacearchaeota archaeon]
MKGQMRVYYDEEADFLEISIAEPRQNYGDHISEDVVLYRDEETDEIVGIGIFNFKTRSKDLQEIKLDLPVNISLFS